MKKLIILLLTISAVAFGKDGNSQEKEETIEQETIGNFALPTSQQPGPLLCFGQNVLGEREVQLFTYIDYLRGCQKKFTEIAPSIVCGILDNKLSIFIETAVALKFKLNNQTSQGLEDSLAQLEYVFYTKSTSTSVNQMTLVGNMTFPTGSAHKTPSTGLGASSFFLGFTASHMATDWYCFTSCGAVLTTSYDNNKPGDQFLYQFGISKNISYRPDAWIFNWMMELAGTYKQRNKVLGSTDPNSGGNSVLLGPSLWFSTEHLIVQGGVSWFIAQDLFGTQNKDNYYIALNIGWKF